MANVDTKALFLREVNVLQALLETVQETGKSGAPAGVMYAALCGVMSLDGFMQRMGILEQAGKVVQRGHCYYLPHNVPGWQN